MLYIVTSLKLHDNLSYEIDTIINLILQMRNISNFSRSNSWYVAMHEVEAPFSLVSKLAIFTTLLYQLYTNIYIYYFLLNIFLLECKCFGGRNEFLFFLNFQSLAKDLLHIRYSSNGCWLNE